MLQSTHVNNLEVSESHSKYMTKLTMQQTHNQSLCIIVVLMGLIWNLCGMNLIGPY